MNSADALPQWNGIVKSGGRLNVARALQNPTVCAYTLDRASQNVPAEGGTYSVSVNAPPNCDYSIVGSTVVQIVSGNVGSGSSIVTFKVFPTLSPSQHSELITVAGHIFTINQAGSSSCTYTLSLTSASFGGGGGRGTIGGSTQAGCNVSTTSNNSFITAGNINYTFENGTTYFTVPFTANINMGAARTGTVTISGQTFTVNQTAGKSRKKIRFF
jgi:hypothetical protein